MKHVLLIIFVCLIHITTSNVFAGEIALPMNAYDWERLSRHEKTIFMQGWLKSGHEAYDNLIFEFNDYDASVKRIEMQKKMFADSGILLGGVTLGQVVGAVDEMYKDSRLKTMDIVEIMPLVSGRLINGWTILDVDGLVGIMVKLKRCKENETAEAPCGSLRKEKALYLKNLEN